MTKAFTTPAAAIAPAVAPALAAVALATLAACSAQTPPPATMPAQPDMTPGCGADQLQSYVGVKATESVLAGLRDWRGAHPVRVIEPGMAVTMDYRPDRLNIELDEAGIIRKVSCN